MCELTIGEIIYIIGCILAAIYVIREYAKEKREGIKMEYSDVVSVGIMATLLSWITIFLHLVGLFINKLRKNKDAG